MMMMMMVNIFFCGSNFYLPENMEEEEEEEEEEKHLIIFKSQASAAINLHYLKNRWYCSHKCSWLLSSQLGCGSHAQ